MNAAANDKRHVSKSESLVDSLRFWLRHDYLSKLIANEAVSRFIEQLRPDIYEQFKAIAAMNSLDA